LSDSKAVKFYESSAKGGEGERVCEWGQIGEYGEGDGHETR